MAGEDSVWGMLQGMIAEAIANIAMPEPAIVTNVYPDTYQVQVKLIYDQVTTGKLRVMESYVGNGYGLTNMPKQGDEVMVLFQGGRPNEGYVIGRMYGPEDLPAPFNYGDWQLKHESGSKLLLDKSGNLIGTSKGNAKLTLNTNGDVKAESSGNATLELKPNGDVEAASSSGVKLTLKASGDLEIVTANGTFQMSAAGQFALKNATAELIDLIEKVIKTISGTSLPPVVPLVTPGVTGIISPAMAAALTALDAQLATLKHP